MNSQEFVIILMLAGLGACSDAQVTASGGDRPPRGEQVELCTVSGLELTASGVSKDGIPALSNPDFVSPGAQGTGLLRPSDLVIGMVVRDEALAIPLSIMVWHEIVNLDRFRVRLAITYCPLTGTAMAFDRRSISGRELGVSGILLENNLVMYDRAMDESLWAQMLGGAICGTSTGSALTRVPLLVTTYDGWQSLHPDTKVLSSETGFSRNYGVDPYEDYARLDAPPLYRTANNQDSRRLPKERVLGIPSDGVELAIPFQVLEEVDRAALNLRVGSRAVVVFWDKEVGAVAAYGPVPAWAEGYTPPTSGSLTFEVHAEGYVDSATGSVWSIEGVAVSGPAEGSRLTMLPDAVVAYWFAWATFNPETEILTEL